MRREQMSPLLLWGKAAWAVVLAACLIASGCREKTADKSRKGIESEVTRGPVGVRLVADREEITIAERLQLTIEVRANEKYDVELPGFGEKLEQFGIVDYYTSQPELVGKDQVLFKRSYVLEPFLSGEYKIPPMKVIFWEKGEKIAQKHEIETKELTIRVKSLLPEKIADLKIHDIAPPVGLPRSGKAAVRLGIIAVAAALIVLCVFAVRHYCGRRSVDEQAKIPPHELAYRELEKLVADDLVNKGYVKEFYQRISDILRRYIEMRFGLHAPEQTTEEFLAEMGSNNTLEPAHKTLLGVFLNHCDLVKFAEHQPETAEIQKTFDSCREFIAETKEEMPKEG